MKLKLLFLSIFIFVHQNFDAMNLGTKYKQLFNKIKSFPSNVYKRYKGRKTGHPPALKLRRTGKTAGQQTNQAQFQNKPKKGYKAGGLGILGSLYAWWSKDTSKAESSFAKATADETADKEKIQKAALKNWRKEIKNLNAFDNKELPEDIKNLLDIYYQDGDFGPKINFSVLRNYDYVVKKEGTVSNRVEGAKAISAIIDQYNLTKIFVPKKYNYVAPNGNKYVVAKLVEQSYDKITKEELEELIFIAKKAGWVDAHGANFLKTAHGLAIVDSETEYMHKGTIKHYVTIYDLNNQKDSSKLKRLFLPIPQTMDINNPFVKRRVVQKIVNAFLTPEAEKYLEEQKQYYTTKVKRISKKAIEDLTTDLLLQFADHW